MYNYKNILLVAASAVALNVATPAFAQDNGAPAMNPAAPKTGTPADSPETLPHDGRNAPDGDLNSGDTLNRTDKVAPAIGGATLGAEWIATQNMPAAKLVGAEVVNAQNETIGEVEEVVTISGRTTLIVSVGQFLGLGGHNVTLGLEESSIFHHASDLDDIRILTSMTEEQLKAQPNYKPAGK